MNETLEGISARIDQYLNEFDSAPDSLGGEKLFKLWEPVEKINDMLEEFWEKFNKKFPPIRMKGGKKCY